MTLLHKGLAAVAAGALLLGLAGPVIASDDAGAGAEEASTTLDAMLEAVQEQADRAGVDVDLVLDQVITTEVPDGEGGLEAITAPFAGVLERLAGGTVLAENDNGDDDNGDDGNGDDGNGEDGTGGTGFAGTPRTNAGNILHIAATADIFSVVVPRTEEVPEPEVDTPYTVTESEWTPDTPIVPGINPFLLVPELADLDPGLPPLVAMHWGGPLKNVQGGGWNVMGAHSAGTMITGSSVDTTDRSEDEDANLPFYVPGIDPVNIAGVAELEGESNPLEEGEMVTDDDIDFLGFAQVVNTVQCQRVTINVPFTQLKSVTDICVGVGVILGDGISFFDGEGPIDFREDLPLLWEPVPEELAPVFDAVDEILGQVPVDEILETVLDAVGDGLPDLPGDEDPGAEDPGDDDDDDDDDDEDEDEDEDLRDPRSLLRGLNRFLP